MEPIFPSLLKGLTSLRKPIAGWLAGFRMSQVLAMRKYQRRLREIYGSFSPKSGRSSDQLPMSDFYIPILVEPADQRRPLPLRDVLADNNRVIVTGEPGTGKSMSLRHMVLQWDSRKDKIPVLIELQQLQGSRELLEKHLVDHLNRAGFFRPEKFAERVLAKGTLLLLLDGLDEVKHDDRGGVVRLILGFMESYRSCDVVITCRTAVREIALFRQMYAVSMTELDDEAIRESVRKRLGMHEASIQRLLDELFNTPRVLALARIPLLLSMMVEMYSSESRGGTRFPASRAQFYQQAVDFLLAPLHGESAYSPDRDADMRRILCHLALENQNRSGSGWLAITCDQAEQKVQNLLTVSHDRARDLLQQIVERTGLLRRADGHYRFAHLTFQEYLAAEALDARALLALLNADPGQWHETTVLWCGIAADATSVIERLLADGSEVVLECLGEAGKIDSRLANRVIWAFAGRLAEPGINRMFGVAASGIGAAADAVLDFLEHEVTTGGDAARRAAAAKALGASNSQRAVKFLGERYSSVPEVREPLEHMRDFAVDVLAGAVRPGNFGPVDGLMAIGTPSAADALVKLLWHDDEPIATRAAWRLAAMVLNRPVDRAVAGLKLTNGQTGSARYTWVWAPFSKDKTVRTIVSRICQLLKEGPAEAAPPPGGPEISLRLAIALGMIGVSHPAHERERQLLDRAPQEQVKLVQEKFLREGFATKDHWSRMFSDGHGLRRVFTTCLFSTALLIVGYLVMTVVQTVRSPSWLLDPAHWVLTRVGDLAGMVGWIWSKAWGGWSVGLGISVFGIDISISLGLILVLAIVVMALIRTEKVGRFLMWTVGVPIGIVAATLLLTAVVLVAVMPTAWLLSMTGSWWGVLVVWLIVLAIPATGYLAWSWQAKRDSNPLRGGLP